MAFWRAILLAFAASIFVEAKWYQHQKREADWNICDPTYNNITHVQCYCVLEPRNRAVVRSAECHLTMKDVLPDDSSWDGFQKIKNATRLTLSNTRGIALTYVPTNAIKLMRTLLKLEIKFGNIEKVDAFAFANLSLIEEITLSDNQIKVLAVNAFADHRDLTIIGLDTNNIVEINRDVFVNLPSLEKLYLTNNKITTIHDKAFMHLENLSELEIDRNRIFSLNSETFYGLGKLQRLDLSGNNLEVIGDNTFLPLSNLQTLNLENNKIQMLDEKAFRGLGKLYTLSLAHNNLTNIENVRTFEGLPSLTLLSLKSNQLVELTTEVMAPILNNLYGNASNLDVEDNNFPCDCRLDWFMSLMNKTQNSHLKLAIENLKCTPSESLREQWARTADADKGTGQVFEDEAAQVQNADYEYYDEAQLNGKLFYIDVREMANCVKGPRNVVPSVGSGVVSRPAAPTLHTTEPTTKATTSRHSTKPPTTTARHAVPTTITTSTTTPGEDKKHVHEGNAVNKHNKDNKTKNKESYTTVRLATVSAKPLENNNKLFEQDMASDEARPERIKAHRSVQDAAPAPAHAHAQQPRDDSAPAPTPAPAHAHAHAHATATVLLAALAATLCL